MSNHEEYHRMYRARIAAWTSRVDEIKTRAAALPLEGRHAMQPFLDAIHNRFRVVGLRLNDLETAPDSTWNRIESLAERAWTEFTRAVERADAMLQPSFPQPPTVVPPPPPASSILHHS